MTNNLCKVTYSKLIHQITVCKISILRGCNAIQYIPENHRMVILGSFGWIMTAVMSDFFITATRERQYAEECVEWCLFHCFLLSVAM